MLLGICGSKRRPEDKRAHSPGRNGVKLKATTKVALSGAEPKDKGLFCAAGGGGWSGSREGRNGSGGDAPPLMPAQWKEKKGSQFALEGINFHFCGRQSSTLD